MVSSNKKKRQKKFAVKETPDGVTEDRTTLKKVLTIVVVWIVILGLGITICEMYVRSTQDYQLFSIPLQKNAAYFYVMDRFIIYNEKFTEERPYYFKGWPIPLETFPAQSSVPRYQYKPNLSITMRDGKLVPANPGDFVYFSTNSLGFRSEEIPFNKSSDTIRIICIGASTTEGSQANNQSYPYYLQQVLRTEFPAKKIEVINAGHHAEGIRDIEAHLTKEILPLKPDIVIFYHAANDVNYNEYVPDIRGSLGWPEGTAWLSSKGEIVQVLYQNSALFKTMYNQYFITSLPPSMPHIFNENVRTSGAKQYHDILKSIASECDAAGTRLVIVSFITVAHDNLTVTYDQNPGLFKEIYRNWYPLTPGEVENAYQKFNDEAKSVATEMNLSYYDVAAEYPKDPKYFPFDYIHFSPEGNQLLATKIAEHLKNDKAIT